MQLREKLMRDQYLSKTQQKTRRHARSLRECLLPRCWRCREQGAFYIAHDAGPLQPQDTPCCPTAKPYCCFARVPPQVRSGASRSTANITADALSLKDIQGTEYRIPDWQYLVVNRQEIIRFETAYFLVIILGRPNMRSVGRLMVLAKPMGLHGKKPHDAKKWIGSGHGSPDEAIQLCQRVCV